MTLLKLYLLNHKKKIKRKKVLLCQVYQSPDSDGKLFEKECENFRKKDLVSSKQLVIIGDMNMNSLDYWTNSNVENIYNPSFQTQFYPQIFLLIFGKQIFWTIF